MSYPYPPTGPGQEPIGDQPTMGWQQPPPQPQFAPPSYDYGTPQYDYGQPGGYYPPPQPPPPSKGNGGVIAIVIVVALVVVVGALGGAYYLAAGGGDDGNKSHSPSASSSSTGAPPPAAAPGGNVKPPAYYNSLKSWALWNSINTRAQDSRPLTLAEVFKEPESRSQKDALSGTYLNLQGQGRLDTDCASTLSGAMKQTIQAYGCTQVVRAAYVSTDKRWVGQLAIYNLRDVNAANQMIDDIDPEKGNKGFFLPVSGPSPVNLFGQGVTGAESGAYGHFVVVGWAGVAGGTSSSSDTIGPSSAVQQAGKEFLFDRN